MTWKHLICGQLDRSISSNNNLNRVCAGAKLYTLVRARLTRYFNCISWARVSEWECARAHNFRFWQFSPNANRLNRENPSNHLKEPNSAHTNVCYLCLKFCSKCGKYVGFESSNYRKLYLLFIFFQLIFRFLVLLSFIYFHVGFCTKCSSISTSTSQRFGESFRVFTAKSRRNVEHCMCCVWEYQFESAQRRRRWEKQNEK